MSQQDIKKTVKIERLFLATDNPRHEEVDDEKEAIERLCKSEDVEELARDIAINGISPSERLIVYPADESVGLDGIDETTTFIVAEGNRRVCALKLLHDPELAPVKIRKAIMKMADGKNIVEDIDVVVMMDLGRRRHWMLRIHDGVQGGKGRKPWNTEQKTRFSGSRRNDIIAQQLFDFAERRGLMNEADRNGNFSHMARLVGNALVKGALGLDLSNGVEELHRNRPISEFETVLSAVLNEAKEKKLGSQARKAKIDKFALEKLNALPSVSTDRIDPEPLEPVEGTNDEPSEDGDEPNGGGSGDGNGPEPNPGGGSGKKRKGKCVVEEATIISGFEELNHDKLTSLYKSVCAINCETHTPLIMVGIWSIFETLAAMMGKNDGKSFTAFFNKGKAGKLAELGLGYGSSVTALCAALENISLHGNIIKHDKVSAFYNYRQVINDMKTLTPLIVACIKNLKQNG